jgi:hypothetical protein
MRVFISKEDIEDDMTLEARTLTSYLPAQNGTDMGLKNGTQMALKNGTQVVEVEASF